jgi:hypothetical protein
MNYEGIFDNMLLKHISQLFMSVNVHISGFLSFFFETGSHYIAQIGLEFAVFLSHPPKVWDYRHIPACLASFFLFLFLFFFFAAPAFEL